MRIVPLIAATYFMVAGGPYGIEDILGGAGYARAILLLAVLPVLWSLPTALMIGELASAIPADGGFYIWVRRALGPFWGYQEGWLSLSASIFDMAIYPAIFVLYLGRFQPSLTAGWNGYAWSIAVVALCCLWNLRGAPAVGEGSIWLFVLLLAPFVVFVAMGFWRGFTLHSAVQWGSDGGAAALSTAFLVAMWNYMGWDNASTIARGVERPERTYPRAMFLSVTLVALTYLLPVSAIWMTGLPSSAFETGSWATVAGLVGGHWLRALLVLGGMVSAFGIFNALVMSYSRLPLAMAEDGMLPRIFAKLHPKTKAPWVAILACAAGWALCLGLGFESLITLDIMLYGASLVLEFVALVALRVRRPEMPRPFRVPGSLAGAVLVGVCPTALLALSLVRSHHETMFGINGLTFGVLTIIAGFAAYYATAPLRRQPSSTPPHAG